MLDRRALPGTLAGIVGLAFAVAAIVTEARPMLLLAALFTVASVVLVLTAPDVPLRYRDRKARQVESARLAAESDQMAARAARFEAEAIAAREQLADTMEAAARRTGTAAAPAPAPADDDDQTGPGGLDAAGASGAPAGPTDTGGTPGAGPITDRRSGVFNQMFFDASLVKRVSAARRGLRPLTVALIEVRCRLGEADEHPADPRPVADILVSTLREADTVAHTDAGLFAVLLEDTPENGAIWTLERLRRRITADVEGTTVRAGVSCYPAYGFDADQLMAQAADALDAAREWRQDRIEVTTADPDD